MQTSCVFYHVNNQLKWPLLWVFGTNFSIISVSQLLLLIAAGWTYCSKLCFHPSARLRCPPKQVPITAGLPAQGPGRLELIRKIWTRFGAGAAHIHPEPNVRRSSRAGRG